MREETVTAGAVTNRAPENYNTARLIASRPDWLTVSLNDRYQEYLPALLATLAGRLGDAKSLETEYRFYDAVVYLQRDAKGLPRLVAKDYCELRFYTTGGRVAAQFTIYSYPFWQDDAVGVFAWAQGLICSICERDVVCTPVRLDLARDVTGFDLDALGSLDGIRRNFVTRSRSRQTKDGTEDGNDVQGGAHVQSVYLGSASAPVRWNIYDKSLEAKRKGKTYYASVWADGGYNGVDRVVRFEARLKDDVWQELSAYGIENGMPMLTLETLYAWLPALWSWLTHAHTRMVMPDDSQSNRSRLVTSAFWTMMQAPFEDDTTPVVALQRVRLRQPKREALGMQSEGCLVSLAALTPGAESWTPQDIGVAVLDLVGWRCGEKSMTWQARVRERRALLAVS